MNHNDHVTEEHLQLCDNLETQEDFAHLASLLPANDFEPDLSKLMKKTRSLNPSRQAKAFLSLASHGARSEKDSFLAALASKDTRLAKAAAFCVAWCGADDLPLLRELLHGSTSWEPSKISSDGRYWVIQFLGYAGDARCAPVLLEALREHGHFCHPSTTARALRDLNCEIPKHIDPEVSISVDPTSEGILISTDEKFTGGSSNCPHCRFFPCRINRYFPGSIQDCSFWNRTDPGTLGGIRDVRRP